MNAKHTPGPWAVRRNDGETVNECGDHPASIVADGRLVAIVGLQGRETMQNAAILAAAPDLLAALEKIDANAAESVEWIRRVARAAIAKATGQ